MKWGMPSIENGKIGRKWGTFPGLTKFRTITFNNNNEIGGTFLLLCSCNYSRLLVTFGGSLLSECQDIGQVVMQREQGPIDEQ